MTVDEAADRLYGVELDEFTAERTRLAKELRSAGAREDADAVAKLRKPTAAAWVLNQLGRRHRREVDLLLDAGHRLREAQGGVLRGAERESFERARKQEVDALRRLLREAEALGASGQALAQVENSLRAAAVSEEGRTLLALGRFVRPFEQTLGFDAVAALAGDAPPAPRTDSKAEARKRAQEALREARRLLREVEGEARAAAREVDRLRTDLDRAETAAAEAEARVDAAQREVDRAERALER
ncbi:MAG TPA: hypothetical protein VFA56_09570 [Gaiellaceae bacterium]|nr:hypothetical protein [Gaiellaceae bacterium]